MLICMREHLATESEQPLLGARRLRERSALALALGAAIVAILTALLLWHRESRSTVALDGYLLMHLWIAVGFGLMKGLWKSGLRLFLGTFLAWVAYRRK
jgi:hypothetical protein